MFKKIGFQLSKTDIDSVVNCVPEAIEKVLLYVRGKVDKYMENLENKQQEPITSIPKSMAYQQPQKIVEYQNDDDYSQEQNQVLGQNQ